MSSSNQADGLLTNIASSSRPILNIPAGNSPVSDSPTPRNDDDRLTGDRLKDLQTAMSRIDVKRDFEHIGQIPCARTSLLYGIGGGAGIGAVRYLGSQRPKIAANWAVGSFVAISLIQWQLCTRARAKELQTMRTIQEQFAHRHISNLRPHADRERPS